MSLKDDFKAGRGETLEDTIYDEPMQVDLKLTVKKPDGEVENEIAIEDAPFAVVIFPMEEEDGDDEDAAAVGARRVKYLRNGLVALGEEVHLVSAGVTMIAWLQDNGLLGDVLMQLALNNPGVGVHAIPREEYDDGGD